MGTYKYSAYTHSGDLQIGTLDANSQQSLLQILHAQGLVPVEIHLKADPTDFEKKRITIFNSATLSLAGWAELTREFGVYLEAGLAIDECLRLMASDGRTDPIRRLSGKLLEASLSGSSLSDAIEIHAEGTPPLVIPLISAGERSGNVAGAMDDLSNFLSNQIGVRKELRGALTYPIVLVVTALATFIVIALTLVPALMPMFEQANASPPAVLSAISSISNVVLNHGYSILLGMVMFAAGITVWLQTARGKITKDQLVLRMPFFGRLIRDNEITLFSKTLGTLLSNGLPLSEGLKTAQGVITNRAMKHGISNATTEILEGSSLADALKRTGQFTNLSMRFVSVGEETSRLDAMLLKLSAILQKASEQRIKTGLALLGPALTIIIGIAIGGLILTVMQAVLGVNDLVLR